MLLKVFSIFRFISGEETGRRSLMMPKADQSNKSVESNFNLRSNTNFMANNNEHTRLKLFEPSFCRSGNNNSFMYSSWFDHSTFLFRSLSIFRAVPAQAAANKSPVPMSYVIDTAHYNPFVYGTHRNYRNHSV